MVFPACNPSNLELEEEGLRVQSILGYICLKWNLKTELMTYGAKSTAKRVIPKLDVLCVQAKWIFSILHGRSKATTGALKRRSFGI
ncbi:mCG1027359 [Mus musculus]|nr:mCG1027359 [Mus musculus]